MGDAMDVVDEALDKAFDHFRALFNGGSHGFNGGGVGRIAGICDQENVGREPGLFRNCVGF